MDIKQTLLKLLQDRLLALGDNPNASEADRDLLLYVIEQLFNAQDEGNGSGGITGELMTEMFGKTATDLRLAFPKLIGETMAQNLPIIEISGDLIFRRQYEEISIIADYLLKQKKLINPPSDSALQAIDWHLAGGYALSESQKLAAFTVATLPLSVISGGAGTGKTTTLTKALELILLDNPDANILLTAPTGKAAYRLNESLGKQLSSVNECVHASLSTLKAQTVHKLLGISAKTGRPRHHAKNPLYCDVLAVDESSMVGGSLFLLLQAALLPHTKLILLGDANQLPAIGSFSFFNEISQLPVGYSADFCDAFNKITSKTVNQLSVNQLSVKSVLLPNHICHLNTSQRFAAQSVIENAAQEVLLNNGNELLSQIGENFHELASQKLKATDVYVRLKQQYPNKPALLLPMLDERIILCANRQGAYGSDAINRYLDREFRTILGHDYKDWYVGRKVMIERNDYQLGLTNGDIGTCQKRADEMVVVFDDERIIPVGLLPQSYSLAFAISIHKSQGSEYPHVDIVLGEFDAENPNKIMTKALLYTAITRAKESFDLYSDKALIMHFLRENRTEKSRLAFILSEKID